MMYEGWTGLAEYALAYPDEVDVVKYPPLYHRLSRQAAGLIIERTHGRALDVTDEESEEYAILGEVQTLLTHRLKEREDVRHQTKGGAVKSASTDGYSETYSDSVGSAATSQASGDKDLMGIIEQYLSLSPSTRAMLSHRCDI